MRLETIPLSLLILLSVLIITEQHANAQVTYDSSKQNPDHMGAQRLQKSYCRWNCTYNHTVIWGMARTLPKMNQPYIVLLIPEAPDAHS
jgi:hypothetical protein